MRPLLIAIAALVLIEPATAADAPRLSGPMVRVTGWQVTECFDHPERHGNFGCRTHGAPETRLGCKIAIQFVVGAADGSRLWCHYFDGLMPQRVHP